MQWHQVESLIADGVCVLDVRTVREYERGHVKGSLHIPLPELRRRLLEIPKDREIVL
ncbi:hypothetical protein BH10CYA1_BH10CYA1_45900 [soil metagenome]